MLPMLAHVCLQWGLATRFSRAQAFSGSRSSRLSLLFSHDTDGVPASLLVQQMQTRAAAVLGAETSAHWRDWYVARLCFHPNGGSLAHILVPMGRAQVPSASTAQVLEG
uniref:Putative secreted protein n=1 Tax=Ixodes ricinus TaxID=34613 RepID=A0A6B0UHC6_IXORI